MQRKRYTENQIVQVLKEVENGLKVADVCRKNGIATTTIIGGNPNMAVWRSAI